MTITVLIPVYDAAPFVADTVRSALAQTHRDLVVRIAVEPGGADAPHEPEASLAALAEFRGDPRVTIAANPERRGWTANINALIGSVETPLYAILPHDDLWHPQYLETLNAILADDPAAGVAYGDIRTYAARRSWRSGLPIARDTDTLGRIFAFFLEGPRGMPWRGLTRTAMREATGGFPARDEVGISAENEYALSLVAAAPVRHYPAVLFAKRMRAGPRKSASQTRTVQPLHVRRAGLQPTWDSMDRLVREAADRDGLAGDARAVLEALVLARRLDRTLTILKTPLSADELGPLVAARDAMLALCRDGAAPPQRFAGDVRRVAAACAVALAHQARVAGDEAAETRHAADAHALAPADREAAVCLARTLIRDERRLEAIAVLEEARRHTLYTRPVDRLLAGLVPALPA